MEAHSVLGRRGRRAVGVVFGRCLIVAMLGACAGEDEKVDAAEGQAQAQGPGPEVAPDDVVRAYYAADDAEDCDGMIRSQQTGIGKRRWSARAIRSPPSMVRR